MNHSIYYFYKLNANALYLDEFQVDSLFVKEANFQEQKLLHRIIIESDKVYKCCDGMGAKFVHFQIQIKMMSVASVEMRIF